MQDLFTQATVALELVSFGYVAGSFAVYAHHRVHQRPTRWVPRQMNTAKNLRVDTVTVSESKRKLSPVELLRQQCQQAGIKWRDAHGKNKHLKKAEMIAALQQLERSRQSPSVKPTQQPVKSDKKAA